MASTTNPFISTYMLNAFHTQGSSQMATLHTLWPALDLPFVASYPSLIHNHTLEVNSNMNDDLPLPPLEPEYPASG